MSNQDLLSLAALDGACLLSAVMMYRSWRRRRTRPPVVTGILMVCLAVLATSLVALGVPRNIVVGPTFILALFVVLYAGRYERRGDSTLPSKPKT
jgi:O-antigen/teichoic acid export membrane protein